MKTKKLQKLPVIKRRIMKKWSLKVRSTTNNTCAVCGLKGGEAIKGKVQKVEADHILSRDIKDSALKLNLLNGIPLCTYHHKFGPYSHHKNPVWFIHWLQNNRPKQFQYVLEHCGDLIDLNNREVVEEIEKKIDSPLTEAEKDILNCTQSGDPTLRPPEKEEEVKEKTIFDNP
jgi:hypothetical protein